jgi:hypothetical protein
MSNSTGPILVGGIPIVWVVVLSCTLIVVGVCALTYPLILLNRWRMREKIKSDNDEMDEEEDEEEEPQRRPKVKGALFGRGRPSTRGKWVERIDPSSNQPYYEHTGTGEVTWTDPRPSKMKGKSTVVAGTSLVASTMVQQPMAGGGFPPMASQAYGAPGGFGAPRPPMPSHGSMGMMVPQNMMQHAGSMGNVLPPQMQAPPRMPAGQPFPGPMGAAPQMPPGNAPPGMVSAGSMRRTQAPGAPAAAAPAADPKFEKYTRMQKAGLPEGAIRNAMNRDGISEADQKTFLGS